LIKVDGGLKNNFSCRKANNITIALWLKTKFTLEYMNAHWKNMVEVLAKKEDCSQMYWELNLYKRSKNVSTIDFLLRLVNEKRS
jgi:hypothetical protein